MTRYAQLGNRGELYAVDGAGNVIKSAWSQANGWSIAIPAAAPTDYFFPLGGERYGAVVETVMHSLSLLFANALTGTFTIEGTNCAKSQSGSDQGGPDISDFDTSAAWQQINVAQSGLLFAVISNTVGGNAIANLTATIAAAGGALFNLPDLGILRLRGRLHATHIGNIRVAANAKLGS